MEPTTIAQMQILTEFDNVLSALERLIDKVERSGDDQLASHLQLIGVELQEHRDLST